MEGMVDHIEKIKEGSSIRGEDGIENMPLEIIVTILGCMPLRYAVRTSVLSRWWRHRWKSVPALDFNDYIQRTPVTPIFEYWVCRVLQQHSKVLNKFSLQAQFNNNYIIYNYLMRFLPSSNIQDFTLFLLENRATVMRALYTFHNLRHLKLSLCGLDLPSDFGGFTRLTTLYFHEVDFDPKAFSGFISLCYMLERMTLFNCTELGAFEIKGPRLKFFSLQGDFDTITFKNSPVLSQVSLSTTREVLSNSNCFHFLPTLEKLKMDSTSLETLLNARRISIPLPECLNSLKVLDLTMLLNRTSEVQSALHLARRSPHLQILKVKLCGFSFHEDVIDFLRHLETPDGTLDHIKKIEIRVGFGSEAKIELIGFLLKAAARLEELEMALLRYGPEMSLWERVLQLPRASPSVRLSVETIDEEGMLSD